MMTTPESELAARLAAGTDVSWWGTPEGRAFMTDFLDNLAGAVVSQVHSKVSEDLESWDALGFLIDTLVSGTVQARSLIDGVAAASSPAGYLVAALVRNLSWKRTVAGVPDRLETITEEHPVRLAGTLIPLDDLPDIGGLVWWHYYQPRPGTLLAQAIDITVDALLVYAPGAQTRQVLRAAVCYLATNPETHKHHGHTEMRHNKDLIDLKLSAEQISALVNVCWGERGPHQKETSLLYQALMHPDNPFAEYPLLFVLNAWRTANFSAQSYPAEVVA